MCTWSSRPQGLWSPCRLVLPDHLKQRPGAQEQRAAVGAQQQPVGTDRRSLLATTTTATSLNPTLECEGCPDTDTRVRVNDTTQFPWTACGMVTRNQQDAISRSICLATVLVSIVH